MKGKEDITSNAVRRKHTYKDEEISLNNSWNKVKVISENRINKH